MNETLETQEELGFITDSPIKENKDDKLQYSNYAVEIASKVLKTKAEKSFAIGINGKWGTGKTSFFNLIKEKIVSEDEKIVIIDFSPWNTENNKSIMIDFFETFEEKLTKYNSNISKKVSTYSEKLLLLNEIESTKPLYNLFGIFLGKTKTLMQLKSDLEKNIENLNKKIIVFIDDLDRLDNSEINEVLKLIRNTADFKNTFFIVAYDRNYIINSLTALNTYNKEGFLEKIFQLEINLPQYQKEELTLNLYNNLIKYFPERQKEFEIVILNKNNNHLNLLFENITSIRDIVLLSNSLILNLKNLQGNVNLRDFLHLEILRIKFPYIYEILKNKNNQFITIDNNSRGYYKLTPGDENKKHLFEIFENYNTDIIVDLISRNKIIQLVEEIFNLQKADFLSIINISKYDNYFSYRLLEKTLDENEFQVYIKKDLVSVKKQISLWIKKGFEFDLVRRFSSINNYDGKLDYQNKLILIFYIANHKSNKSENIIGFDSNIIQNRFGYYPSYKERDYSFAEHKKFIENLLLNATYPFHFEAKLVHEFNSKNLNSATYKFPLTKDDLELIANSYLDFYIKNYEIVNENLIPILTANSKSKAYPVNKPEFSNNLRENVINYFDKQETEILIKIFINKNLNTYNIVPEIFGIYNSMQKFKNYFNERSTQNNSDILIEFLSFTDNLSSENNSIRYEFDKIQIQK